MYIPNICRRTYTRTKFVKLNYTFPNIFEIEFKYFVYDQYKMF